METINELLPVILYILLTILVIVLIVFVIRLIKTLSKVDKVVDDVNRKVSKLDGVFNIIDTTTDTLSLISDKVTNFVINKIGMLFTKKSKKKEEDENE
ncbi:MAG: hypothetical protein RR325_00725 [Bacilli bacterium]